MPLVSVVITAHNYGKYLRESIESVLSQHFDDYELIIVNDASTDNSGDILRLYESNPKITIINLHTNVGLSKAANISIKRASGDFIIRLDADDYFDENILLILCNFLLRHPAYGMVYPDYYEVTKHRELVDVVRQQKARDEVKLLDRSALAAGALYRNSCYEAIGGLIRPQRK